MSGSLKSPRGGTSPPKLLPNATCTLPPLTRPHGGLRLGALLRRRHRSHHRAYALPYLCRHPLDPPIQYILAHIFSRTFCFLSSPYLTENRVVASGCLALIPLGKGMRPISPPASKAPPPPLMVLFFSPSHGPPSATLAIDVREGRTGPANSPRDCRRLPLTSKRTRSCDKTTPEYLASHL